MRINYLIWGRALTGGTRVIFEIANGLVARGHDVTVTSVWRKRDREWLPLKAKTNFVEKSLLLKVIKNALRRFFGVSMSPHLEIEELAKATPDCDINVATYFFTAYSVFRSEKGIPFYHMQHYEPLIIDDPYSKKLAETSYHLTLNRMANSVWLKNLMKEKFGYDTPVVNPAIDHRVFYPRDVKKESGKRRVLCFGKQARWKGFPEALEAMRIVMKKRDDVEFSVYGENPSRGSGVQCTFIKRPSDNELAELYSSSDIVICPSWYESFPLPPIEAMACGAPVVTTRYGTEDYAFHEKNCLVVPPRDPRALASNVLRLLQDEGLRERFRKEGPKTARGFTWDKTVNKVEKLFQKAMKGGNLYQRQLMPP